MTKNQMADETIPEDVAAMILAKCGRHCCICRRFLPVRLQVHHIIERSKGGTNDPDNLIAVCLHCHTDIHSKVPFTQRFSVQELKSHRELTYKLVEEGKLRGGDDEASSVRLEMLLSQTLQFNRPAPPTRHDSDPLGMPAIKLLMEASKSDGLLYDLHSYEDSNSRETAAARHGFRRLIETGLIEHHVGVSYAITHAGYEFLDGLLASLAEPARQLQSSMDAAKQAQKEADKKLKEIEKLLKDSTSGQPDKDQPPKL